MADSAENTETTENETEIESSDGGSASKTLTQAEVDAIVEQRLARERKKYSDYDALKEKAAKFEEAEAEKLSELERERVKREAAEQKAASLQAERDAERIRSAIVAEAVKQGAKSTDAVLRAIDKTGLELGDDGQVSGAAEAVSALLTEIPELVGGRAKGESPDLGARGSGPGKITSDQLAAMSPEAVATALAKGELQHLL